MQIWIVLKQHAGTLPGSDIEPSVTTGVRPWEHGNVSVYPKAPARARRSRAENAKDFCQVRERTTCDLPNHSLVLERSDACVLLGQPSEFACCYRNGLRLRAANGASVVIASNVPEIGPHELQPRL